MVFGVKGPVSPGLLFYLHYQNNIAHLVLLNYLKKLL